MKRTILALGTALMLTFVAAGSAQADQALWDKKCSKCHGKDGKADTKVGKKKGISDMTSAKWQKSVTDQAIIDSIIKGVDREEGGKKIKMKAVKGITPAQAEALKKIVRGFAK